MGFSFDSNIEGLSSVDLTYSVANYIAAALIVATAQWLRKTKTKEEDAVARKLLADTLEKAWVTIDPKNGAYEINTASSNNITSIKRQLSKFGLQGLYFWYSMNLAESSDTQKYTKNQAKQMYEILKICKRSPVLTRHKLDDVQVLFGDFVKLFKTTSEQNGTIERS